MVIASLTTEDTIAALTAHTWSQQPEAAALVSKILDRCLQQSPFASSLAKRMLAETGTRFVDWIDHFGLTDRDETLKELNGVGYTKSDWAGDDTVWVHHGGLFPRIRQHAGNTTQFAIKVESVVEFLFTHNLTDVKIEGEPFSPLRKACLARDNRLEFWIVERHGTLEFDPPGLTPRDLEKMANSVGQHWEALHLRRRQFETDAEGFAHANELIDSAINDLGTERACDLFFDAERAYWLHRNRAGQIQYARQNALGLGWANHDHHTYRSSRDSFAPLIAFLEKLGFVCRERFYAGREAGWGAQVIEHSTTGVTIFADVDLSPEELAQDFSHEPLAPRNELGTVGLWCALHGEAFLQAGMHHLECQFDFAATRDQLKLVGIETMPPFTDYSYLRQAFTRGEQWQVDPRRIERLRYEKKITDDQAKQFLSHGAIGSHMEILQRDDGYKGFNQRGINEIISATDPRRAK
jgi:hypothetical protein